MTTRAADPYTPPLGAPIVIHEDAEILAIDKPSGLLSVPGKGPELADCLISRVQAAWPHALLVHRLDRDTSGVIIFALSAHAQRFLSKQFELRATRKKYIARVAGRVSPKTGRIDLPIGVDWPNRPKQMVDYENGRPAITDWRVMRDGSDETRLELKPQTGRSHQLRVHCLALGHPILGDPLYASGGARDHARLMLHAAELRIKHPESGKMMRFQSKAPF